MHRLFSVKGRLGASLAFSALFIVGITFAPQSAAASTIVARQILPLNEQACPQVGVSEIIPYIYDGALDSFDINVTDASYVALGGSVGDTTVAFNYMTRRLNSDGTLRIHVDIQSFSLKDPAQINILLVSAHPGNTARTCVATITATVPAVPGAIASAPKPAPSTGTHTPPAGGGVSVSPGYPKPVQGATSTPGKSHPVNLGLFAPNAMSELCISPTGTARLWIVLLVLYAVFIGMLFIQNTDPAMPRLREWYMALTLAVLIVLLLFWYMSAACRTGAWAPTIATLLACVGCIAIAQKHGGIPKILLLKEKGK